MTKKWTRISIDSPHVARLSQIDTDSPLSSESGSSSRSVDDYYLDSGWDFAGESAPVVADHKFTGEEIESLRNRSAASGRAVKQVIDVSQVQKAIDNNTDAKIARHLESLLIVTQEGYHSSSFLTFGSERSTPSTSSSDAPRTEAPSLMTISAP